MERKRLSGCLLAASLLALSGITRAAEVLPQQTSALAATVDEAVVAAPSSAQDLRARVGMAPATAAARVELTEEDSAGIAATNAAAPTGAPLKVGVVKPLTVAVDLQPIDVAAMSEQTYSYNGGLVRRADGRLAWEMRLDAEASGGVRLHFTEVQMPAEARIFIYNDAGDVWGPYQGNRRSFWSHTVSGSGLYVQVDQPDLGLGDVRFQIDSALVIDAGSSPFCENLAPCVEDGSCHGPFEWEAIDAARKAVAHINFVSEEGGFLCSGGLLADTDDTTTIPYFLTANHCIDDQALAETMETWFFFITPVCGANCPPRPYFSSTLGASLLDTSAVDDHSLLVLDEPPPRDSWYLGWTDRRVAFDGGDLLFRLSHPLGAAQAYSVHAIDTTMSPDQFCATTTMPRGAYIYSRNHLGAVQNGSSGAPVMLPNGQVVGQLFGLCGYNLGDACDANYNRTVDGAFANYYSDVARWLDPDPNRIPLTVHRIGTGKGRVVSSIRTVTDAAGGTAGATGATGATGASGAGAQSLALAQAGGQSGGGAAPMIAGAAEIGASDAPWHAALTISTWRVNEEWRCAGSVIDPYWILTSARCITHTPDGRSVTVAPANIQVRTGANQFEWGGQVSKVGAIYKHPDFDPETLDNDLALLKLKSPVYVEPIRLVTYETENDLACIGTAASVTGWGSDLNCGNSTTPLSTVSASIVAPSVCAGAEGGTITMTNNKICTNTAAAIGNLCQLDDGAPLVVSNGRGGWVQAGVVSEGNACGSDSLTAYTRVANYVVWMQEITGLDLWSRTGSWVIDCGSTCLAEYIKGSFITLTATPSSGSVFWGWAGACRGTEPSCEISMDQALTVKAIFQSTEAESVGSAANLAACAGQ